MAISGSCLCGAVSYEITGSLAAVGHCHCSRCRKSHGAAFATWAIINPDQFRWTSGVEFVQRYESSPGRERCFCKKCGAPLVATHSGKVTEVVLGQSTVIRVCVQANTFSWDPKRHGMR
jgi:hypothetical protein